MRLSTSIFIALFLAVSLLTFSLGVFADNSSEQVTGHKSEGISKFSNHVLEELQQNETIDVIVTLKEPEQPKGRISAASEIKARRDSQDEVINSLGRDFESKSRLYSVNSFSGKVNSKGLEKLMENSEVAYVSPDYKVYIALQDSLPLVNATSAFNLKISGINITGEGQTVCVLDTGVNYSHSDLGNCFGNGTNFSCKIIDGYDFVNNDSNPYDDNSHGTHVIGIIAANGAIKGVAPDARIVAIKVLDSTGTGSFSYVDLGIEWCINNSGKYNITAISGSLATNTIWWASYCDSYSPSTTTLVNNAVAKNISVFFASGNQGKTTSISAPACIHNATAVGGTDKSDSMYTNGNRNNITDILAPGVSINSTDWSGGYSNKTGTSMATPHVAGAAVLLRQFKLLESQKNLTCQEVHDTLNQTGRRIYDSGSGLYFSRIDVDNALFAMDDVAPYLKIDQPENITYNSSNILINLTAQDNVNFINCNYSIDSEPNITLPYCVNSSFNASSPGSHSLTVYAIDGGMNINYSTVLFNLAFEPHLDYVDYTTREGNYSRNWISANLSSNSSFIDNMTVFLFKPYNNLTNNLTNTSSILFVNFTNLGDGTYYMNASAYNTAGSFNYLETYKIALDTTAPNVSLVWPENGASIYEEGIDFLYTSNDEFGIANCSIYLNNVLWARNYTVNANQNNSIYLGNVQPDAYSWNVSCSDLVGNAFTTSQRSFTAIENYNVSYCRNITRAGRYVLNSSITDSAASVCINISVSDVEIDCVGWNNWIDGKEIFSTKGIQAGGSSTNKIGNISVKNCNVTNWNSGIVIWRAENSTIHNITASRNTREGILLNFTSNSSLAEITSSYNYDYGDGIQVENSLNTNLTDITLSSNSMYGLSIDCSSKYSTIRNVTASYNTQFGFGLCGQFHEITEVNCSSNLLSGIQLSTYYSNLTNITVSNNSRYGIHLAGARNNYLVGLYSSENGWGNIFDEWSYNNTIINVTRINNSGYDINSTNGEMTSGGDIGSYTFSNVTLTIKNSSYVSVSLPNITQNGTNFSDVVIVRNNYVFINSTNAPGLNRSANITFYGLGFSNPRIIRDGVPCSAPICYVISWNSSDGTLIFNVTGFSAYYAEETPVTPPSSGGGGGGGRSPKVYESGALTTSITRQLASGDSIKFSVNNENHTLKITSLNINSITVAINSRTITETIPIGEKKEIDFEPDGKKDIEISYDNYTTSANVRFAALTINPLAGIIQGSEQPKENVTKTLCGNGVVDTGENCRTCPDDAKCREGEICMNEACTKISSQTLINQNKEIKKSLYSVFVLAMLAFGVIYLLISSAKQTAENLEHFKILMKLTMEGIQSKDLQITKDYYSRLKEAYESLPKIHQKRVYNRVMDLWEEIEVLEHRGYFSKRK